MARRGTAVSTVELQRWLDDQCSRYRIDGAALSIADHELHTVLSGSFQDVYTPLPLSCIAKVLTTVLLLQLCERGRLRLDTPLVETARFCSKLAISDRTTIGHLLAHTSGIVGCIDDRFSFRGEPSPVPMFVDSLRQQCAPGMVYSYAHSPFILAGAVLREVTGKNWAENVRDVLVARLNGQIVAADTPDPRPRGRDGNGDATRQSEENGDLFNAAFGRSVQTDVATLAAFGFSLLKDNEHRGKTPRTRLLADLWLDQLRESNWVPRHGRTPFPGLGVRSFQDACFGHRGLIAGRHTLFLVSPNRGLSLALVTATPKGGILAEMVAQTFAGASCSMRAAPFHRETVLDLTPYLGSYHRCGKTISVELAGDNLSVIASQDGRSQSAPMSLTRVSKDAFVGRYQFRTPVGRDESFGRSSHVEFIADAKGHYRWARLNEKAYAKDEA